MPRYSRLTDTTRRKCVWFVPKTITTVHTVQGWAALLGIAFTAAEPPLRLGPTGGAQRGLAVHRPICLPLSAAVTAAR
jgi:hypothetical protein